MTKTTTSCDTSSIPQVPSYLRCVRCQKDFDSYDTSHGLRTIIDYHAICEPCKRIILKEWLLKFEEMKELM